MPIFEKKLPFAGTENSNGGVVGGSITGCAVIFGNAAPHNITQFAKSQEHHENRKSLKPRSSCGSRRELSNGVTIASGNPNLTAFMPFRSSDA